MVGANMLRKDDILGVQINSVLLTLINFRKFIAGDKKWVLSDNPKKRKSSLVNINIDCETKFTQKKFWCAKVRSPN